MQFAGKDEKVHLMHSTMSDSGERPVSTLRQSDYVRYSICVTVHYIHPYVNIKIIGKSSKNGRWYSSNLV